MASIKGFQMKGVKNILGREGYGCTASLYLNGKKIGTYEDYGDGAPEEVDYVSKEAEADMMRVIIAYAKEHPNNYIINLYKERPAQYERTCEIFKKYHPYIPDEDITIETMASNSIVYIVEDFLSLLDMEKEYKKYVKKGYKAIAVQGDKLEAYPATWTDAQITEAAKGKTLYSSPADFIK